MTNDLDLDLDVDELEAESKGQQGQALYDKSLGIIKDAMKDVKQEILIKLEDGTDHIVYITEIQISGNGVSYGFSTPSEDRKVELTVHVEKILQMQLNDLMFKRKMFSF